MSTLWEAFLDLLAAHVWIRWVFFAGLLVLFWGNWGMISLIVVLWAVYEIVYWARGAWRK